MRRRNKRSIEAFNASFSMAFLYSSVFSVFLIFFIRKEVGFVFGISHYEMFLLAGIVLNITPGSDTLYILGRSVSQGKKAGLYSVLGISSGCAVHTLLAALGLSELLAQSAEAFMAVKIAGALYLGYLGLQLLRSKESMLAAAQPEEVSRKDIYLQGLLTNVLNPKVALFFVSFLPQFIDSQNQYGILPFMLLGVTFLTTGTLWCLFLVFCSARVTACLRQSQTMAKRLNKI